MKNLSTLILLLLMTACSSVKSSKYDSSNEQSKVIYYALPKTLLNVTLELEKTQWKYAKYQSFATCMKISKTPKDTLPGFKIKSVKTGTSAVLDSEHVYQTKIVNGFLNKADFANSYSESGELTNSSVSQTNQIIPFTTSTIKFATSLFFGATTAGLSTNPCYTGLDPKDKVIIQSALTKLESLNSELEALKSEAADYRSEVIYLDIKKSLEKQKEKILKTYFTPKKTVKTTTVTVQIDPSLLAAENDGKMTYTSFEILKILTDGISFSKDCSIYNAWDEKNFKSKEGTKTVKNTVLISLTTNNSYAKKINANNTIPEQASFYYYIPSNNIVDVTLGDLSGKQLQIIDRKSNIQLTQFGRVVGAPKNLSEISFELYPKTGALKSIKGKSATVDLEQLQKLEDQIVNTKNSIEGEDAIDAKIKKLQKEVELKELEKKLEELENSADDSEN